MIISPDWLKLPATLTLRHMFEKAGSEAFFVGGCVRNSLMNVPVSDLDLATPMLPQDVMNCAKKSGIKALPTGLQHGTVTLMIDEIPFEITTFRDDVTTDGRNATVAFSTDMSHDAQRRDFTMNAIYADFKGNIFDPLGGLEDLKTRRVCFIGTAETRIQEDYLRILRFFRFHAQYGDHAEGLDAQALAACAARMEGLAGLSKERVTAEMMKLLAAPNPATAIGAMETCGILNGIMMGASGRSLFPFMSMEPSINPIARLAALGGEADQALRLSKKQSKQLDLYKTGVSSTDSLNALAYTEGADFALGVAALRAAIFEQPMQSGLEPELQRSAAMVFPVSAPDLMPALSGAELGAALKRLKMDWIASNFTLTKVELLGSLGKPNHDAD